MNPEHFTPQLQKAVEKCCDFVTMPLRAGGDGADRGALTSLSKTDRWIEWAIRTAKLPIVGGPIVDFRRGSVPEWLYIWEHDYETLRELVGCTSRTSWTRYRQHDRDVDGCERAACVEQLHADARAGHGPDAAGGDGGASCSPTRRCRCRSISRGRVLRLSNTRAMPPLMYAEMPRRRGSIPTCSRRAWRWGRRSARRSTRDLMACLFAAGSLRRKERPLAIAAVERGRAARRKRKTSVCRAT